MLKIEDYKTACKIAARIVAKFGDAYLPIFQRTLEELKKIEQQNSLKEIATQMAKDY